VRGDGERHAGIDPRQFLDADAIVDGGHPGAAVLLRPLNAEQSERRELRHQFDRKVLRLIPLHHVRANLGFRKLAHGAPEQLLIRRQAEIHHVKNDIMAS